MKLFDLLMNQILALPNMKIQLRETLKITGIMFCLISNSIYSQSKKELQFIETTKAIATSIAKADTTALKNYTDPSAGLYVLYSIGVNAEYFHVKALSFDENAFPPMPPYRQLNKSSLKYETLPSYNCDSMNWNKQGCFVDTAKNDSTLTELLKTTETISGIKNPKATLTIFETIEKNGRRVIVTSAKGDGLIMHLLYKNKQWYLVVVDLLVTNCGV